MARGRQGFLLEGWKFGVYLSIPVLASWYFGDPERQRASIDYWKYIHYPAAASEVNYEEEMKKYREQQDQRLAYREQLKALQQAANTPVELEEKPARRWWPWGRRDE